MKFWRRSKSVPNNVSPPAKAAKRESVAVPNGDFFLDDGEPLSYDEEVTLHHASQYPHLTQNYSFQYNYRRNTGKPVAATPAPTGTLSIESILNSNPDLVLGSDSTSSSLHNRSYPSSIRTTTGTRMMRRLSSRFSFIGSSHDDDHHSKDKNSSSGTHVSGSVSGASKAPGAPDATAAPGTTGAAAPPTAGFPVPQASKRNSYAAPPTSSSTSPSKQSALKIRPPYASAAANSSSVSLSSRSSPFVGSPNSTTATSSSTRSENGEVLGRTHNAPHSQLSKQPSSSQWTSIDGAKTMTMSSTFSSNLGSVTSSSADPADTRDRSLSPPGPMELSSSPVSSLIFERSVQEFGSPSGQKIPAHYLNENFIPPVLEASANAITDNSVDPDMIEVISLRARHMSISPLQESAPDFATVTNVTSSGSSTDPNVLSVPVRVPSPNMNNAGSPVSPNSENTFSRKTSLADLTSSRPSRSASVPSDKNQHVLTFYSYADVVYAEGNNEGSYASPNKTISPVTSESIGHQQLSPISSSVPRIPGGFEEKLSPTSTGAATIEEATEDEELVDVSSMGETLRRNTGEIAANHIPASG